MTDDANSLAEAMERLKVSRARATQLVRQKGLPDPVATIGASRI